MTDPWPDVDRLAASKNWCCVILPWPIWSKKWEEAFLGPTRKQKETTSAFQNLKPSFFFFLSAKVRNKTDETAEWLPFERQQLEPPVFAGMRSGACGLSVLLEVSGFIYKQASWLEVSCRPAMLHTQLQYWEISLKMVLIDFINSKWHSEADTLQVESWTVQNMFLFDWHANFWYLYAVRA